MNWKAVSKLLIARAGQLAAAILIYWQLHSTLLYEFTAREMEGLNTLILLLGSIYAVMFAFVIFVIWGQFTDVENFVMRECNSLKDVLRFSDYLNAEARQTIRRAVSDYVNRVLKFEWHALAERRRDRQTEAAFSELMNAVVRTVPANDTEAAIHGRLIDIVRKAGEHRDDRVAKSLTRIPPTLLRLVTTMALALLLLVFVYPFHSWVAGACCFFLVAVVLLFAGLVMTDTDNPFEGVCNVSPKPFSELML